MVGLAELLLCQSSKLKHQNNHTGRGLRDVIQAIKNLPKRLERRTHEEVVEIHQLLKVKASHVHRGANMLAHQVAIWVPSKFSTAGNPHFSENVSVLSWLYAGTEPP